MGRPRVVIRCDGDDSIGAGHVARCLPLATVWASRGWSVSLCGRFAGLSAWLVESADLTTSEPVAGRPAGVDPTGATGAVVDSYAITVTELCELAREVPLATIAEANRCEAGVVVDYHLDRDGALAGPRYAPLDPRFAGAAHPGNEVRRVLITVGASRIAHDLLPLLTGEANTLWPWAELDVAGGAPAPAPARALPPRTRLIDIVDRYDVAITAAGLTSYELACAGLPQMAIGIADNQRRVVAGLRARAIAPCVDIAAGEPPAAISDALRTLADPAARLHCARLGMEAFDGRGAERTVSALSERFLAANRS